MKVFFYQKNVAREEKFPLFPLYCRILVFQKMYRFCFKHSSKVHTNTRFSFNISLSVYYPRNCRAQTNYLLYCRNVREQYGLYCMSQIGRRFCICRAEWISFSLDCSQIRPTKLEKQSKFPRYSMKRRGIFCIVL